MRFLNGLFSPEIKGEEQVRRVMAGNFFGTEGQPYKNNWSVDRAVKDGLEASVTVYKCIDTIATAAARLPLHVRKGGRTVEYGVVEGHPLAKRMASMVNEFETGAQFLYRLTSLLLMAKQGVFVERVDSRNGANVGLYILPSDYTYPVPGDGVFVEGYEVHGRTGETFELEPDQVIWVRKPHPTDPYSSLTPLEAAGLSVDTEFYARQFNRDFMLSDGRPAGMVGIKGSMGEEDLREVQRRFRGTKGKRTAAMAGEITVVEAEGLNWIDLATSRRDAQYVEATAMVRKEIREAFGVPESLIGDASGRCVDEDTEALTQRGWVSGRDLTEDDTILSMDLSTGSLVWGPVREVYRNESYTGAMYEFHGARVSAGHKWVVEARPGQGVQPYVKKKIEDLSTHDRVFVMGDAEPGLAEPEFSNAFVELVGWAVTEPNEWSRREKPGPSVRITQNPGEHADRIRACAKEAGARMHEFFEDDEILRFDVRGEIAAALQEVAPGKVMTHKFMLSLTAEQRDLLIETMVDADGARQEKTASLIYTQASRERAENMVFLATLAGRRTSLRLKRSYDGEPTECWQVIIGARKVVTAQHGAVRLDRAAGEGQEFIWCPRTDHGTFVARRNGKVFVTSNTFDNADAEKEAFWEQTMLPLLDIIASALDPLTGAVDDDLHLVFDVEQVDVLARNKRMTEDRLLALFTAGLITADEFREGTHRPPVARPGSRVLLPAVQGKTPIGSEADEKAVGEAKVLGGGAEQPPPGSGGSPGGGALPSRSGAPARSGRREEKHSDHLISVTAEAFERRGEALISAYVEAKAEALAQPGARLATWAGNGNGLGPEGFVFLDVQTEQDA